MAQLQRYVIMLVLASMVSLSLGLVAVGPVGAEWLRMVSVAVAIGLALARIVLVYRLAVAVGISVGWAVVAALCGLHGFLGLISLLVVNARATKLLKQAGLRVGLLGVPGSELARL